MFKKCLSMGAFFSRKPDFCYFGKFKKCKNVLKYR